MQCMFGLEHCTLARGQATPIEDVYVYPLLLEAGWLPGGGSLTTCMKSGGFVQGVTNRVGQREGKYSCIAHNKDTSEQLSLWWCSCCHDSTCTYVPGDMKLSNTR